MSFLPSYVAPGLRQADGGNCVNSEIAVRLEAEGRVLGELATEVRVRDALTAGDVAALDARLGGAAAQLARVRAEIASANSLALVSQAQRALWTGTAIVAGGLDRL